MTYDDPQESYRHQLLGVLFGSNVPHVLEGQLLRTSDVAALFQVSERTVSEWAKRGQIPSVRTPGGHRRFPAKGIRALLQEHSGESEAASSEDPSPSSGSTSTRGPASVTDLSDRRNASA